MQAKGAGGIHAEQPTRCSAGARHLGFRVVDIGKNPSRAREINFTLRREREAPSVALNKAYAEAIFQPCHEL